MIASVLFAAAAIAGGQAHSVVRVASPNPAILNADVKTVNFGASPLARAANAGQKQLLDGYMKDILSAAKELAAMYEADFGRNWRKERRPASIWWETTPTRVTNQVISFEVLGYVDAGGAHPSPFWHGFTYILRGGRPVKAGINQLINLPNPKEFIMPILVNELKEQGMEGWEDFKAGRIEDQYLDNFVVEDAGVRWLFPNYSVGAYAEGAREVRLSWSRLSGLIRPGFGTQ